MKNGMYVIGFEGAIGILTFEDGVVYGVDQAGVKFDGGYVVEGSGMVRVTIKVTYPPYVSTIFGVTNPYEWSIDVAALLDPAQDFGETSVETSIGPKSKAT